MSESSNQRPAPGSRWSSEEMLEVYLVIGWIDEYGGMVTAVGESTPTVNVLLRPEDFGTRLRAVADA